MGSFRLADRIPEKFVRKPVGASGTQETPTKRVASGRVPAIVWIGGAALRLTGKAYGNISVGEIRPS